MPSTKLKPSLSPRLETVAACVPDTARVIDIGTDHALLPISLVLDGKCQTALAMDIRQGPLLAAQKNIRAFGVQNLIETRLSDGFGSLRPDHGDVVVISGMGGFEMISILESRPCRAGAIVLQPQKSVPELRQWLSVHGYRIDKEALAVEKRHAYIIMVVAYDGQPHPISKLEQVIGPAILKNRPDGFPKYLDELYRRLKKQLRGDPTLADTLSAVEQMIQQIEQ